MLVEVAIRPDETASLQSQDIGKEKQDVNGENVETCIENSSVDNGSSPPSTGSQPDGIESSAVSTNKSCEMPSECEEVK